MLLVPAWTLAYWQAWLYWALATVAALATALYFLKRDPALMRRRLAVGARAERLKSQKIIQAIGGVMYAAIFIVAGTEHRVRWLADSGSGRPDRRCHRRRRLRADVRRLQGKYIYGEHRHGRARPARDGDGSLRDRAAPDVRREHRLVHRDSARARRAVGARAGGAIVDHGCRAARRRGALPSRFIAGLLRLLRNGPLAPDSRPLVASGRVRR